MVKLRNKFLRSFLKIKNILVAKIMCNYATLNEFNELITEIKELINC